MTEHMTFPKTTDDFIKQYSFKDEKQEYTNGAELIPVFRVKQMMEHYIANGATVQQWIPVTERLPEPYTQVITLRTYLLSGDSYPVGLEYVRLHGDANIPTWSGDYATWKNKVTHWMSLPALPKES